MRQNTELKNHSINHATNHWTRTMSNGLVPRHSFVHTELSRSSCANCGSSSSPLRCPWIAPLGTVASTCIAITAVVINTFTRLPSMFSDAILLLFGALTRETARGSQLPVIGTQPRQRRRPIHDIAVLIHISSWWYGATTDHRIKCTFAVGMVQKCFALADTQL